MDKKPKKKQCNADQPPPLPPLPANHSDNEVVAFAKRLGAGTLDVAQKQDYDLRRKDWRPK